MCPRPESPLASVGGGPGHETAVAGLWHIGASTHPGPGLGAGSGYLVAKELTRPPIAAPPSRKAPRTLVIGRCLEISTRRRVRRGGRDRANCRMRRIGRGSSGVAGTGRRRIARCRGDRASEQEACAARALRVDAVLPLATRAWISVGRARRRATPAAEGDAIAQDCRVESARVARPSARTDLRSTRVAQLARVDAGEATPGDERTGARRELDRSGCPTAGSGHSRTASSWADHDRGDPATALASFERALDARRARWSTSARPDRPAALLPRVSAASLVWTRPDLRLVLRSRSTRLDRGRGTCSTTSASACSALDRSRRGSPIGRRCPSSSARERSLAEYEPERLERSERSLSTRICLGLIVRGRGARETRCADSAHDTSDAEADAACLERGSAIAATGTGGPSARRTRPCRTASG